MSVHSSDASSSSNMHYSFKSYSPASELVAELRAVIVNVAKSNDIQLLCCVVANVKPSLAYSWHDGVKPIAAGAKIGA